MNKTSPRAGIQNLAYIEQLYASYQRDPGSVPAEWGEYFAAPGNGSERWRWQWQACSSGLLVHRAQRVPIRRISRSKPTRYEVYLI